MTISGRIRRYRAKSAAKRLLGVYMAEIDVNEPIEKTHDELTVEAWLFHVAGYDETAHIIMLHRCGGRMVFPNWYSALLAADEARDRART